MFEMFWKVRIILAATIFLSFHVLIDNVPLSEAKKDDRENVFFYRFAHVGDNHASSSADTETWCVVLSRGDDGKWEFGKKVKCVIWPQSTFDYNMLGRRRRKVKRKHQGRRKDVGKGLMDSLLKILGIGIDRDTRNKTYGCVLEVICRTIIYTVFIALLQKVVSLWKSMMSRKRSSIQENKEKPIEERLCLENIREEAVLQKDIEVQTNNPTEIKSVAQNNKAEELFQEFNGINEDEAECDLSCVPRNMATSEDTVLLQRENSNRVSQNIQEDVTLHANDSSSENDVYHDCLSDSTSIIDTDQSLEIIDITDENRVERKLEGAIYPSREGLLMNVSHFDLFYTKTRSDNNISIPGGNWILVDDDLVVNETGTKGCREKIPIVKESNETLPTQNSQVKDVTSRKLSACSMSDDQSTMCDKQYKLNSYKVDDICTEGSRFKCGFQKDNETPSKDRYNGVTKRLNHDQSNGVIGGTVGGILNVQTQHFADGILNNQSNHPNLEETNPEEIGKCLHRHSNANELGYILEHSKGMDITLKNTGSSMEITNMPDGVSFAHGEGADDNDECSDEGEDSTLVGEDNDYLSDDSTVHELSDSESDAESWEKDLPERENQDFLSFDEEKSTSAILVPDQERQGYVMQGQDSLHQTKSSSGNIVQQNVAVKGKQDVAVDCDANEDEYVFIEVKDANVIHTFKPSATSLSLENLKSNRDTSGVLSPNCDQQYFSVDESAKGTDQITRRANENGEQTISVCIGNRAMTFACGNDSGVDCTYWDMKMKDKCIECSDGNWSDFNCHEAPPLSATCRHDIVSGFNTSVDFMDVIVESILGTENGYNTPPENQADKENTQPSMEVEKDKTYDDERMNLTTDMHNDIVLNSSTADDDNASEVYTSQSTSSKSDVVTSNDGIVTGDSSEFDESMDANMLELFWGEIIANYDPQRLMDSFENYERLREQVNKEATGVDVSVDGRNELIKQATESTATSSAEQPKAKNTALKNDVLVSSHNRQVSLLMDMPLRHGSTNIRRIDPIKAMKFWLL